MGTHLLFLSGTIDPFHGDAVYPRRTSIPQIHGFGLILSTQGTNNLRGFNTTWGSIPTAPTKLTDCIARD